MREAIIPIEFAQLQNKVHYVQRVTSNEYSSSCPHCGGFTHQDGSFPDRFRMWISSEATGKPMGWCRQCGFKWWQNQEKGHTFTDEEKAEFKRAQEIREQEKIALEETALGVFTRSNVWEEYHNNLNERAISLYAERGIEDYWLEYWKLGLCYDREYSDFHSESLTIPIYLGDKCVNVKHRLLNDEKYKYSYQTKGLPKPEFVCDREKPLTSKLLIIEGEFKAMTTYITLDDNDFNAAGIGSVTPRLDTLDKYKGAEEIYLILDPDANTHKGFSPLRRITDYLGEVCRVVYLPGKVDDLIMQSGLNKDKLKRALSSARPLT